MEFVCIEAKTFMEMNEALEAVVKKMCETCGSGISGMDDWIDNQEACMLMDASPRKMLQLRRSRAIPYSYIDRKVYYKRQDIIRFMENNIHRITLKSEMIQSLLTKETPESFVFPEHRQPVRNAGQAGGEITSGSEWRTLHYGL